jgi:hypothetical protein
VSSGQKHTKGDYWARVHSDQMVLGDSQASEAGLHEQWPKDFQRKPETKGGLPGLSPSGQMVLVSARQGGWTASAGPTK